MHHYVHNMTTGLSSSKDMNPCNFGVKLFSWSWTSLYPSATCSVEWTWCTQCVRKGFFSASSLSYEFLMNVFMVSTTTGLRDVYVWQKYLAAHVSSSSSLMKVSIAFWYHFLPLQHKERALFVRMVDPSNVIWYIIHSNFTSNTFKSLQTMGAPDKISSQAGIIPKNLLLSALMPFDSNSIPGHVLVRYSIGYNSACS